MILCIVEVSVQAIAQDLMQKVCERERERGFRVGYSRVWVSRYWGFAFRVLGLFRALGFFRASYRG